MTARVQHDRLIPALPAGLVDPDATGRYRLDPTTAVPAANENAPAVRGRSLLVARRLRRARREARS